MTSLVDKYVSLKWNTLNMYCRNGSKNYLVPEHRRNGQDLMFTEREFREWCSTEPQVGAILAWVDAQAPRLRRKNIKGSFSLGNLYVQGGRPEVVEPERIPSLLPPEDQDKKVEAWVVRKWATLQNYEQHGAEIDFTESQFRRWCFQDKQAYRIVEKKRAKLCRRYPRKPYSIRNLYISGS